MSFCACPIAARSNSACGLRPDAAALLSAGPSSAPTASAERRSRSKVRINTSWPARSVPVTLLFWNSACTVSVGPLLLTVTALRLPMVSLPAMGSGAGAGRAAGAAVGRSAATAPAVLLTASLTLAGVTQPAKHKSSKLSGTPERMNSS